MAGERQAARVDSEARREGSGDADARANQLIEAYLAQVRVARPIPWGIKPAEHEAGQAVLAAEPAVQVAAILRLVESLCMIVDRTRVDTLMESAWYLEPLLSLLFRRNQPYTEDDIRCLLAAVSRAGDSGLLGLLGFGNSGSPKLLLQVVRQVERYARTHTLTDAIRDDLQRLRRRITGPSGRSMSSDQAKAVSVIDELLGLRREEAVPIDGYDDWGHAAQGLLEQPPAADRAGWLPVLQHAATASATKPSGKWLDEARRRIDALGADRFREHAIAWLGLLDRPTRGTAYAVPGGFAVPSTVITDRNGTLLRGLAWHCALLDDAAVARSLGGAALAAYKKVPEIGPRSVKTANACVWALGAMPAAEGATQLQRLKQRVVYGPAGKLIEDALLSAATRAGLTRDDLDDLATPGLGLEAGRLRRAIGGYTVEAVIAGAHEVTVRWLGPDGLPRRSEPAALKRTHPEEMAALRRDLDELRTQLGTHRLRTERILASRREWSLAGWRERWLEHPLLSFFARRLIWVFEGEHGMRLGAWHNGALVDVEDRPLALAEGTRVRLWHPITSEPATVLAWRLWLERHGVTQPFKQAHREVYLLTDAERQSRVHSNRFVAHLLRQHQLRALCQERGWSYRLQGAWDGQNNATIDLPEWGLSAELTTEAPDDEGHPAGRLTHRFVNVFVTTGEVRFFRYVMEGSRPTKSSILRAFIRNGMRLPEPGSAPDLTVPLEEVPPVVFSEVMRDADLFVGVCSIGAAPTWDDAGLPGAREFWEQAAFGDLTAAAHSRRDVLERLLPRLAIAARCTLAERFLEVRGDLHTYRIHLGSGNIIMDDGRYLCIVPGPGAWGTSVYLPFEGDAVLSLILSKAFLLADDCAITDPMIRHQIDLTSNPEP